MRRLAQDNAEASRIMLGLLDPVEQDRAHSQRHLASELGIALTLVNASLKRRMKKARVKVQEAPARRYAPYDKIRILDGAFAECLGLYQGMRDSGRVASLLDLFGRQARVAMDVKSVAAA